MPWFKVDDGFYDHPKVIALQGSGEGWEAALALWLMAGSWASKHLTDGEISSIAVMRLGSGPEAARRLVKSGMWDETDAGFKFHDWCEYQPTKVAILSERESTSNRVRRWRKQKRTVTALLPVTCNENVPVGTGREIDLSGSDLKQSKKPKNNRGGLDPAFDAFWKVYPLKVGKLPAAKAWNARKPDPAMVTAALAWQIPTWKDPKFIPHPASWLNAERWLDEPPVIKASADQRPTTWAIRDGKAVQVK